MLHAWIFNYRTRLWANPILDWDQRPGSGDRRSLLLFEFLDPAFELRQELSQLRQLAEHG